MPHVTLPAVLLALLPGQTDPPPDIAPDLEPPVVETAPPGSGDEEVNPFDPVPTVPSDNADMGRNDPSSELRREDLLEDDQFRGVAPGEVPPGENPPGNMTPDPGGNDPTGRLRRDDLLEDDRFRGVAPGEVPPGENPPGNMTPADAFRLPPAVDRGPNDPTGELRDEGLLRDGRFEGVAPGMVPPGENPPGGTTPGEAVEGLIDSLMTDAPPAVPTLTPLGELIRAPYDIYDAREYVAANCLAEAEQVLMILLDRNPADPRLHYLKFVMEYRQNRFDESFATLEEAVRLETADPIIGYDDFMRPVQGVGRVYLERVRGLAGIGN